MNWGQAALAAGAGLLSLGVFIGGGLVALRLSITQFSLGFFGSGQPTLNPVVAYVGILAVSVVVVLGLTLPALALGAGWRSALGAAAVAGTIFFIFAVVAILPIPFKAPFLLLVLIGTPGLISASALWRMEGIITSNPVLIIMIAVTVLYVMALLLLNILEPIVSYVFALVAWPVLPALASLLQQPN